jgi:hypothetical protein
MSCSLQFANNFRLMMICPAFTVSTDHCSLSLTGSDMSVIFLFFVWRTGITDPD